MSDHVTVLLVQATFVALIAASALTWAIVIVKALQQRRITRQTDAFLGATAKVVGVPSSELLALHTGPAARVASAGAEAWRESADGADGRDTEIELRTDLLERSLKQQLQRERRAIEAGLPVLASVGSMSPFVGLFGTVLGIIHALTSISRSGSASLEVVAGPIGEALVATAIGIAVAVPAVIAYNYFLRRLKTYSAELEEFANAFVVSAVKSSVLRVGRPSSESSAGSLSLRREASV
jgi:biopolymer transport protein ExbB